MKLPIKIIQASHGRWFRKKWHKGTGSTVMVNVLYGFLSPSSPVFYTEEINIGKPDVIKTHNLDIDGWVAAYSSLYDLYFILTERDVKYDPSITSQERVLVIRYEDILESETRSLTDIVNFCYNKVSQFIPNLKLDRESAVKRLRDMNSKYEEIKEKSFSEWERFYGLHGNHRHRGYYQPQTTEE